MNEPGQLICPYCGDKLKNVSINGKYGQNVIVDQCVNCGGIWFDEWELFAPEADEIKKIDNLDEKKLTNKNPQANGNNRCPKCETKLERLNDPFIPEAIEIKRCNQCDGFWLNRGETSEYKNWQKEKRQSMDKKELKTSDDAFNKSVENFLVMHKESSEILGQVGNILSTPINSFNYQPIGIDDNNNAKAQKIVSVAATILEILFRILLRR